MNKGERLSREVEGVHATSLLLVLLLLAASIRNLPEDVEPPQHDVILEMSAGSEGTKAKVTQRIRIGGLFSMEFVLGDPGAGDEKE